MSSIKATKYGTGLGYIYLTNASNKILTTLKNNKRGKEQADKILLSSSSVVGETLAVATISFTSGLGDITDITIDGVSIFNTSSAITGLTITEIATNTAVAINSFSSTPNYTASVFEDTVYIFIQSGFGSTKNGSVLAVTSTATLAYNLSNLDGGTSSSDIVDAQTGYKVWIDDRVNAPAGDITDAEDVSRYIVRKPFNSPIGLDEYTISGDTINIERNSSISQISVDTQSSASTDDLKDIVSVGFNNGDLIVLSGTDENRVVTLNENGNIKLANSSTFSTGDKTNQIILQYISGVFYEVSRSPSIPLTVANLRSAGFPQEVLGYQDIELTAGGGTINLEAGVDEKYIRITGSAVTLSASWTIQGVAGAKEGDSFLIYIDQQVTLSGNSLTIFGISLTSEQALSLSTSGKKPVILAQFVNGWRGTLILNSRGRDLIDTTQLATKEDDLGNPADNGYILSSLTDGTRSWVENTLTAFNERMQIRKNMVDNATLFLEKTTTDALVGGTVNPQLDDWSEAVVQQGALINTFNLANGVWTVPESGYYYVEFRVLLALHSNTPESLVSNQSNMTSQASDGYWMKRETVSLDPTGTIDLTRTGKIGLALTPNTSSTGIVFGNSEVITDKTGKVTLYTDRIVFLNANQQVKIVYANSTDLDYYGVPVSGTNTIDFNVIKLK